MTERQCQPIPSDSDAPFFNVDEQIGEGRFYDRPASIRLMAHLADETYRYGQRAKEPVADLVPLTHRTGSRTYVLARPYTLEPQFSVTVALFDYPRIDGAIGQVVRSEVTGTRQQPIGTAQAWYYQADRVLILWECFLGRRYCADDDPDDPNLHALWRGFERFLLDRFPDTQRVATPAWEPLYPTDRWQAFLRTHGYETLSRQAYGKEVRQ